MDIRFPFSPAEVAKVRMVQFGILSPDEIVIYPKLLPNFFTLFPKFLEWRWIRVFLSSVMVLWSCWLFVCVCFSETNVCGANWAWWDDGEREAEGWRIEWPSTWNYWQKAQVWDLHGQYGWMSWPFWSLGACQANVSHWVFEDGVNYNALCLLQLL